MYGSASTSSEAVFCAAALWARVFFTASGQGPADVEPPRRRHDVVLFSSM